MKRERERDAMSRWRLLLLKQTRQYRSAAAMAMNLAAALRSAVHELFCHGGSDAWPGGLPHGHHHHSSALQSRSVGRFSRSQPSFCLSVQTFRFAIELAGTTESLP